MAHPVIFFDILETVAQLLNDFVDVEGVDSFRIARIPFDSAERAEFIQQLNPPEVIISPGRYVSSPENEGNNKREDVYYPVLIQFYGSAGAEWFDLESLKRELGWEQQTRKFFVNANLRNLVFKPEGYLNKVIVSRNQTVDPTQFVLLKKSISFVVLEVSVREGRNTEGTV